MKLVKPQTNPTPIGDWKTKGGEYTLSHEELIAGLASGNVKMCNIVDGPTDAIVLKFPPNEWSANGFTEVFGNAEKVSIGRWIPENIRLVPVRQFQWTDDFSWMRTMTCENHPSAKYYTKNPYERTMFLIASPNGYPEGMECECGPEHDVVVCNADGIALGKPAGALPYTEDDIPALPNDIDNWRRYADPVDITKGA